MTPWLQNQIPYSLGQANSSYCDKAQESKTCNGSSIQFQFHPEAQEDTTDFPQAEKAHSES